MIDLSAHKGEEIDTGANLTGIHRTTLTRKAVLAAPDAPDDDAERVSPFSVPKLSRQQPSFPGSLQGTYPRVFEPET
jgi:hypothetical protein